MNFSHFFRRHVETVGFSDLLALGKAVFPSLGGQKTQLDYGP